MPQAYVSYSLLPKFTASIDRQAAGSKKVFLCDTGIVNVLGKASLGQLFEQSIFQNLRSVHELAYYNKEGRSEIDFILDKRIGLEAKLSASRQDMENLKRRAAGAGIDEYYLVSLQYSDDKKTILAIDI